jgi:tetratricopeptide (TPR) repeat protein
MRKAFGAPTSHMQQRPYSATLHHLSSIAGDHDHDDDATSASMGLIRRGSSRPSSAFADFAAPSPSKHPPLRSSTPPLDPTESALLHECEALFRNMKQRSYHYAPPAPLLYTADGADALQSRNLMGDDVEVHLLTPLERIVRWNLRAQLAFRNEQYGAAEIHLKNALTALHNAEKDRRRAARRRGRRSSQGGHTSDGGSDGGGGFGTEESTAAFEPSTSGGGFHSNAPATNQNPHGVPSTAESWTSGYGNLSLQNVKMLTYTTKAFLERTLGRYRDALQDLQTVLKVQEQQQEDMAMHARQHQKAAEASGQSGGVGRRSVMIVSPRDDSEKQLYEHMEEYHCGVQPDTLVNISALLLQVGNRPESLNFGRRAVEMLTSFAAAENQRMYSRSTSPTAASGGAYQQRLADEARRRPQVLPPAAASPRPNPAADASDDPALETPPVSARLREGDGVLLRHRQLFIDAVAALHNVAMTQSSEQVAADVEGMARRRVGKSSHAAALRLGRTVLGNDHAVVVRVESSARQVAQLLAQ